MRKEHPEGLVPRMSHNQKPPQTQVHGTLEIRGGNESVLCVIQKTKPGKSKCTVTEAHLRRGRGRRLLPPLTYLVQAESPVTVIILC